MNNELFLTEYLNDEWEVETQDGWKDFGGIAQTIILDEWRIETETGLELFCAGHHFVFIGGYEIKAEDLSVGDLIETRNGSERVVSITRTGNEIQMFDLLDVDGKTYFTNGIRSHNSGKSTSFEIFVCWYILFNDHKNIAVLANKAASSLNILRKVKVAFEMMPKWLQSGIVVWNQSLIELENGCRALASATSSSAIRSFSINVVIIDEMGFIPATIWSEFYASVYPTISSSKKSKTILVSTPNGMNHFWRFWSDANSKSNNFNPIEIKWNDVPGRDQKWYTETRANMSEAEFNQEFGGSFLGSSHTLIACHIIESLAPSKKLIDTPLHTSFPKEWSEHLNVYKNARQGNVYIMSADSSKMRDNSTSDAICIQVIDITKLPYRQVCTFFAKSGISYLQAPEIIYRIGKYFNDAYAFVENNEIGQQVVDSLAIDFEYDNVFYEKSNLAGYRTTKKTKRLGCSNLKAFVENQKLRIVDIETIQQLSTFVRNTKGSFEAEYGYQDDAIMALIGCLFFLPRPEFDSIKDRKTFINTLFNREEVNDALVEDMPFFGVIDDGSQDDSVF